MEAHFGPFGAVLVSVQDRCTVSRQMFHSLRKSFWMHRMILLGDEAQTEAHFGPFGYNANLDSR
jgi:hypothetical protein